MQVSDEHTSEPVSDVSPTGQAVHEAAPVSPAYVLAGQDTQRVAPVVEAYVPFSQEEQAVVRADSFEDVPGSHALQDAMPSPLASPL